MNTIHQLTSQTYSQMMSYVIETDDNKIIVIDGGNRGDTEYLLNYIKRLKGSIKIDAWFLTHVHSDHMDAIMEAYNKHECEFTTDRIYYNFPSADLVQKYEEDDYHTSIEFLEVLPKFKDKTVIVKTGDIISVGQAEFEILYMPNVSVTHNFINNTSIVIKMYLAGQTMLFLGDLGVEAGDELLKASPEKLKSDFVEMAHHGQNGVGLSFYEAVRPSVCFWDTPKWLWDNDSGNGYNTSIFKTIIVQGWMNDLKVKHNFISKDGTNVVKLPFNI